MKLVKLLCVAAVLLGATSAHAQFGTPLTCSSCTFFGSNFTGTPNTFTGAAPQLTLNNGTSNRISWSTTGVGVPAFTSYSAGVKLVLFDTIGASNSGYTIGIAGSEFFFTAGTNSSNFKFYGGTTVGAVIGGTGIITNLVGGALASATTIAPNARIHHITGTTTIQTITAPSVCAQSGQGCELILIFDGVAPWNAAGNIFVAGTPTTAGTVVIFTYDNATSKFYPSRTL